MSLLAAAGLSAAGGLASSALGLYGQRRQQKATEKMYKNRHQWEVADLRKAGLNPILSATGGQPPSPQGAGLTPQNISFDATKGAALTTAKETAKQSKLATTMAQSNAEVAILGNAFKVNAYKNMANDQVAEKIIRWRMLLGDQIPSSAIGAAGNMTTSAFNLFKMLKIPKNKYMKGK